MFSSPDSSPASPVIAAKMNNSIDGMNDPSATATASANFKTAEPPRPLTPNPDDPMSVSMTPDPDHEQQPLPPITTASLPSERQLQILNQSWGKISSRSPLGCRDRPPDFETLVDFAATILETRLADVVKHRRDVKLAPRSHNSSMNSDDGHGLKACGPIDEDGECDNVGGGGIRPPVLTEGKFQNLLHNSHGEDASSAASAAAGTGTGTAQQQLQLSPVVLLTSSCRFQIRQYVRRIANMYRDNRYHALEHAVHVMMSANKLLDMLHEGTVESDDDVEIQKAPTSAGAIKSLLTMQEGESCDGGGLLHGGSGGNPGGPPAPPPLENGAKFVPQMRSSVPRRGMLSKASSYRISNSNAASSPNNSSAQNGNIVNSNINGSSIKNDTQSHTPRPKRHKRSSTYLIYSSTFTKFSFVFAAYIHDVDHQGVPNARLVHENDPIAELYEGKSVAEKHSIKVAFRTLSENDFDEFRSLVFESPDDQLHMHRIVTNLVISTDIASPERMQSTKMRWEEAFSSTGPPPGPLPFGRLSLAAHSPPASEEIATVTASEPRLVSLQNAPAKKVQHSICSDAESASIDSMNSEQRRTSLKRVLQMNGGQTVEYHTSSNNRDDSKMALRHSVVIETMINVADVAHSMQSWELFCFWNRNLYEELYDAYKSGRSENDPAKGWYENQLFFYKIYVLPLAEKMKKCGAFGDLGGEFYKNALSIRDQWDREGEQITKDMIASVEAIYSNGSSSS